MAKTQTPITWNEIQHFFTPGEIGCMKNRTGGHGKIDLGSYESVKANAGLIYQRVADGSMPLGGTPWKKAKVGQFLDWVQHGCPETASESEAHAAVFKMTTVHPSATRIRKNINDLSTIEFALLVKAFKGVMAKDPTNDTDSIDPNSYFAQAGYHWFPAPTYCQHHMDLFLSWHRAYVYSFENALRSVEGCESVTLPYWDITTPFPERLKKAPFDYYTYPINVVGENPNTGSPTVAASKGDHTQRNTGGYKVINQQIQNKVVPNIKSANKASNWEGFNGFTTMGKNFTSSQIIAAHDQGHVAVGPQSQGGTMGNQDIAAFDPCFWFFHANWDRVWWVWQKKTKTTTLQGLIANFLQPKKRAPMFQGPSPLNQISPFTENAGQTIDSVAYYGVDYEHSKSAPAIDMSFAKNLHHSTELHENEVKIHKRNVTVHVEGVDRLKIPGTFHVLLLKNGKTIDKHAFFQPNEAGKCPNCVKMPKVDFAFTVPLKKIKKGKISIAIEVFDKTSGEHRIPLKEVGNPTISFKLPFISKKS
ncbi:MAG: tyrosinase family protein [Chitinophagales bacterium]